MTMFYGYEDPWSSQADIMTTPGDSFQLERCDSPDIEWISRILTPEVLSMAPESNMCMNRDGSRRKCLKMKNNHKEERIRRMGSLPETCTYDQPLSPTYGTIVPKQEVFDDDELYGGPKVKIAEVKEEAEEVEEEEEERKYIDLSHTGQSSTKPVDLKVSVDDDKGVVVEMYGLSYPIDVSTDLEAEAAARAANQFNGVVPTRTLPPFETIDYIYGRVDSLARKKPIKATTKNYPRFKRLPRGCRLWEFIRDLLHNPRYNPSHIRWTDISRGEFRLIKTHEIARMWGEKKNNEGMTYEKLSRAMSFKLNRFQNLRESNKEYKWVCPKNPTNQWRYYYKRQILAPVLGKRLIYRFGPKSYGWN